MVILYDGEIYYRQRFGGVNRYFDAIISGLPPDASPVLLSHHTAAEHADAKHPKLKVHTYKRFGFRPGRLSYLIEPFYFRAASLLQPPQIAHPTYYSLLSRQGIDAYKCPVVLTVHDMLHEIFPSELDPSGEEARIKRNAISAADAIICDSENTKRDLERFFPEAVARCVGVIPLASGLQPTPTAAPIPQPSLPAFVYVGGRAPHKNFGRLLAASAQVAASRGEISLTVVGVPFNQVELSLIRELGLSAHIRHVRNAPDAMLAAIYRDSIALVYPSLYEGFGIPPLEAMSCGTAVIAANSSSIPEVVGDAALLFDPRSTEALAAQMLRLLDCPTLRASLISRGHQRAQQFSWKETANKVWSVYKGLAH
jgi:glycosyltransferase involved in cell wall biosynthesis